MTAAPAGALVAHPDVDKIAFTGSTEVGREIAATAGRALKRVTLELGGKSPNIILPDADIDAAVAGAFSGIYFNSGQVCTAGSRLMVQKDQFDDVVNALAAQAEATVPGPGLDPTTFVGPLVSSEQHARVSSYIDKGRDEAELVAGGGTSLDSHPDGYFVKPTLFTSTDDNASIVREEIFGPVLVAQPYDTIEDVARRANDGRLRPRGRRVDARREQRPQGRRAAARRAASTSTRGVCSARACRSAASSSRASAASTARTASARTSRRSRSTST